MSNQIQRDELVQNLYSEIDKIRERRAEAEADPHKFGTVMEYVSHMEALSHEQEVLEKNVEFLGRF